MREFSISAKVLMISQILLLVSVCIAVVFIFMDAEQRTVDSLLTIIIDRKGKLVNDYIRMEIQQPVDTVRLYAAENVQEGSLLSCHQSDGALLQGLMDGFIRATHSQRSGEYLYPYVYISYEVNQTFWGECGCNQLTNECYNYDSVEDFYRYYTIDAKDKKFNFRRQNRTESADLYMATINLTDTELHWTSPYFYQEEGIPEMLVISITKALTMSVDGFANKTFSMDVRASFLTEILHLQRKSTTSTEYLLVLDPLTERLIGTSIPCGADCNGKPASLVNMRPPKDAPDEAYYRFDATPDETVNAIGTTIQERNARFTSDMFEAHLGDKNFYFSATEIHIVDGPLWILMYAISENEIMSDVMAARSTSYMVSATVISLSCVIGVIIMRSVLSPLKVMSIIVLGAAQMDVESISRIPKSNVSEVAALQEDINALVGQLKEFRMYLPESVLTEVNTSHDIDNSVEDTLLDSQVRTVKLTFVSRDGVTAKRRPKCVFAFEYKDGKPKTYNRLVRVCRQRAGIAISQSVQLQVRHDTYWMPLTNDDEFFTAAGLSSDALDCRIGRSGIADIWCLVRCALGILAIVAACALAKAFWDIGNHPMSAVLLLSLSLGLFANLKGTHTFLKKATVGNPELSEWLRERVDEASFGMFIGAFSVMNLEVIACKLTILNEISLHAPFSSVNLRMLEKQSIPGLLLGPLVTVVIALVYLPMHQSGMHEITWLTSAFCLNLLYLIVTMKRLISLPQTKILMSSITQELSEEQIKVKTTECTSMTLYKRHVSLLFCVLVEFKDFVTNTSDLTEIEEMCNQYYEITFRLARRFSGVVTKFEGGDVTILFNGTTDVEHHETMAAECAFAIMERKRVCCAIVSDVMKVGNLGTSTRRAFQHISPSNVLCQSMAELAVAENCPILVTQAVADACPNYPSNLFTEVTFKGKKIPLMQLLSATATEDTFRTCNRLKNDLLLGPLVRPVVVVPPALPRMLSPTRVANLVRSPRLSNNKDLF